MNQGRSSPQRTSVETSTEPICQPDKELEPIAVGEGEGYTESLLFFIDKIIHTIVGTRPTCRWGNRDRWVTGFILPDGPSCRFP